mmetsp:Transcript_2770/g.8363  ORF Transcript_2770/g.8363 Transcript_2770/m.8363 type:complete len:425 (-) Transcript_2770:35-1309(-)
MPSNSATVAVARPSPLDGTVVSTPVRALEAALHGVAHMGTAVAETVRAAVAVAPRSDSDSSDDSGAEGANTATDDGFETWAPGSRQQAARSSGGMRSSSRRRGTRMRTRPGSAFELERRWGPLPPTAEPPQSLARAPRPRHKTPADEPRVKTLLPLAQRLAEAKRRHASKPRQRPSAGSLKMLSESAAVLERQGHAGLAAGAAAAAAAGAKIGKSSGSMAAADKENAGPLGLLNLPRLFRGGRKKRKASSTAAARVAVLAPVGAGRPGRPASEEEAYQAESEDAAEGSSAARAARLAARGAGRTDTLDVLDTLLERARATATSASTDDTPEFESEGRALTKESAARQQAPAGAVLPGARARRPPQQPERWASRVERYALGTMRVALGAMALSLLSTGARSVRRRRQRRDIVLVDKRGLTKAWVR